MGFTAVVDTTIRVPTFFDGVCENAKRHNRENIRFYVIGDHKTPLETAEFCASMQRKYGYSFEYYDVERQNGILQNYPSLSAILPFNWGGRKLFGNIVAYLDGAETLIMLDDDNFVGDGDFFGAHSVVGKESEIKIVRSDSGWFNVYNSVIVADDIPIHPRSYPWSERFKKAHPVEFALEKATVAVTNGLVLEDPDIDAIARLFWPIRVTGFRAEYEPNFALSPGVWTSWNNQNTSISRAVVPVYFTPASTGRNADIWTSYVLCKLTEQTGEVISFGQPLVKQFRNPHDLWRDLDDEIVNNKATETFVRELRATAITSSDYGTALKELIDGSMERLGKLEDLPEAELSMMRDFWADYRVWNDFFTDLNERQREMEPR